MTEEEFEQNFNEHISKKTAAYIGLGVVLLLIILSFFIPSRAN